MFWLCLDLDELAMLDHTVTGFGHNRRAWASIHDSDYAGPGTGSIRDKLVCRLMEGGVSEPVARITLYTLPRVCGYVFNPVNFYFCYRPDETLAAVVAEVHNTFGEGHHYVLRPEDHRERPGESLTFRAAKSFYVSPFLEVSGAYEVLIAERADGLRLQIELEQGGELMFTAAMTGQTTPMCSRALAWTLFRLPFLAATVMLRIHWQAFQLSLFKRLPVFPRSDSVSAGTFSASPPSIWHRIRALVVHRAFRKQSPSSNTTGPLSSTEQS